MEFKNKIQHLCTREGLANCWVLFSGSKKSLVFSVRYKSRHSLKDKFADYYNLTGYTDGSTFSIGKVEHDDCWSIAHIPSETIIFSGLKRKRDAESIMAHLKMSLGEDYDSIWLYDPHLDVDSDLLQHVTAARDYYLYTKSYHFKLSSGPGANR